MQKPWTQRSAEGKDGITQKSETRSISRKSLDKLMVLACDFLLSHFVCKCCFIVIVFSLFCPIISVSETRFYSKTSLFWILENRALVCPISVPAKQEVSVTVCPGFHPTCSCHRASQHLRKLHSFWRVGLSAGLASGASKQCLQTTV